MSTAKQNRRKGGVTKLEPIDWHEFANDAVLNGNMSTLYHRPASEDPRAYASPEALLEIEKRAGRPAQSAVVIDFDSPVSDTATGPTVGFRPPVGVRPAVGTAPDASEDDAVEELKNLAAGEKPTVGPVGPTQSTLGTRPTDGVIPAVGTEPPVQSNNQALPPAPKPVERSTPTVGRGPTVCDRPAVGGGPTVGIDTRRRTRPIKDVQDALTLAGQVLYKAMYGVPDGAKSKSCTKGYRQLAAETHLDKDTVRDLITEFKEKGLVRETATYDSDTRSAKTYEVLSYKAILQMWRDAGLLLVTSGRNRPMFCTAQGEPLSFRPAVGTEPVARQQAAVKEIRPTVGPIPTATVARSQLSQLAQAGPLQIGEVIQALQQITAGPVDHEAADRLVNNCHAVAGDCTIEEIVEFAWSKAFLCRSGKIDNPVGFLITQVPKHFQGEALQAYRDKKRKELEAAAEVAARQEKQRRETEREMAELEERCRIRTEVAERHRKEQGIDLKAVLQDSEADDILKEWAKRMLKLGHRYHPHYD